MPRQVNISLEECHPIKSDDESKLVLAGVDKERSNFYNGDDGPLVVEEEAEVSMYLLSLLSTPREDMGLPII